eukprot:TRINITY_DN180_c1_g1_i1.p1 TRINITY_DN180_c1_g1~~TRINITY_DN180_c1_g1_i1.p1  ORF type:complete len:264 (+),score=142.74 TRINITY_DN180_c1_g1_i1:152-943(+)
MSLANVEFLEAVRANDLKRIKECLEHGADVNVIDHSVNEVTALMIAAEQGLNIIVKVLIEKGANINAASKIGLRPVHFAAASGRATVLNTLFNKGADINAITQSGKTILHKAAFSGDEELLLWALRKGVDPTVRDCVGSTVLHSIVELRDFDCFDVVFETLATICPSIINIQNNAGLTALSIASSFGDVEVVNALLSRGADTNIVSNTGNTPLHEAGSRLPAKNFIPIIEALVKFGANKTIQNSEGKTAFDIAVDESKHLLAI